jgi:two-component system response regulator PilR (NtrC family)
VSRDTLAILERYHWPGNIRELENVVERAIVLGNADTLEPEALPPMITAPKETQEVGIDIPAGGVDLEATLDRIERRYIQLALERTEGVQTRAAELLKVSFRQFRYKLQKHKPRPQPPATDKVCQ